MSETLKVSFRTVKNTGTQNEKNKPFSTAERSERVENFLFAQRVKVPADQKRAGAAPVSGHVGAAWHAADHQVYNHVPERRFPRRGSFFFLRSSRALCCSAASHSYAEPYFVGQLSISISPLEQCALVM